MNLMQFPKKLFDDIWLARVFVTRRPKQTKVYLTKECVEGMPAEPGSYICKIKRLTDAYAEQDLLLTFDKDDRMEGFAMSAAPPEGTGLEDGNAVYIQLKPYDLLKWFRSKRSKGLEELVTYEDEDETAQEAE